MHSYKASVEQSLRLHVAETFCRGSLLQQTQPRVSCSPPSLHKRLPKTLSESSCVEFQNKSRCSDRATSGKRSASPFFLFESSAWHLVVGLDKVLLMASTVGWQFRRVVLSHLCFEGKTRSRRDSLHFQKKKKKRNRKAGKKWTARCLNSLQRGSKMTGLVTFFFVCFPLYIRKICQCKCKNCIAQDSWEALNTPLVSSSVQIFLQNGTSKIPGKKKKRFTFYTAFPLRSTDK